MHRILEYTLFFIALFLLQVFLFDNLSLSVYLAPLVYVSFLVLLPLNISHGLLVLIGFATGLILDVFTGTGGLHTIAATFTGFIRPGVVNLTMGKDFAKESGGVVTRRDIRSGKWLRYSAILTLLHCTVYFLFEALTWKYFGYTVLKIMLSSAFTVILVWFIGYIYPQRK